MFFFAAFRYDSLCGSRVVVLPTVLILSLTVLLEISLPTECLSREFLDKERVRKNSRRAREYMAAYFILSVENADEKGGVSGLDLKELKPCAATANAMKQ